MADQLPKIVALIQLMKQSTGEDPLTADVHAAASTLTAMRRLKFRFEDSTPPWSLGLQRALENGFARGLLWEYWTSAGSLLPRPRVGLTAHGAGVADEAIERLGHEVRSDMVRIAARIAAQQAARAFGPVTTS